MFSLVIDEKLRYKISVFLDNYLNSNIKNFFNTWLETEKIILESYEEISEIFKEKIYLEMEKIFSEEIIFQKIEKWRVTSSFSVWNFRFVIEFSEDKVEKIRFLENVEIYKK